MNSDNKFFLSKMSEWRDKLVVVLIDLILIEFLDYFYSLQQL